MTHSSVLDPPRSGPPGTDDGGPGRPPGPPPFDNAQQPGPDPTPDDTHGWRCPMCNIDWPDNAAVLGVDPNVPWFDHEVGPACPVCLAPTHFASNINPIPLPEAWSLRNHAAFDRYYESRGERSLLSDADLATRGAA